MATKVDSSKSVDPFVHEHERLRQSLGELRWLLEEGRSPERVAPAFEEFADHVQAHFTHEEELDGFFDAVVDQAPRLKERADLLIEEHDAMSRELARLQRYANAAVDSADWWSNLRDAFDSFWQLYRRHERAEHDLVQEAFHDDIGSKD